MRRPGDDRPARLNVAPRPAISHARSLLLNRSEPQVSMNPDDRLQFQPRETESDHAHREAVTPCGPRIFLLARRVQQSD